MLSRKSVTAVLGPTNTGKTHLAIERLCGHSSGVMGFPLRLLAREVYERVVAIKGAASVGLVTGEEKIVPPGARWLLCTAESMPVDRDVAFVAIDEAQLGADPERGHVFTDRLLRARGREETMILGSATLAPMVRALVPEAEIVRRPRFSTLSYAGAKKLSRIPKRSAIVAFSAEEVYAVAEMLRRTRGGAAVVMGALSPRTRNAQVAMYQAGEVDYLVATDAIGMGLNMDIGHVAFASLSKFDGYRQRRLTVAEMAQIAGRAGRHQRDGTFGSLGSEVGPQVFRPEEIEAIEEHRFGKLEHLYWRDGEPDLSTLDALIESLEAPPGQDKLRAAPQATDLVVLKRLSEDPDIRARARGPLVKRLWAACSVPDFKKVGPDHHARLVGRLFKHLSEGEGHVPVPWFADEIARLDRVEGDVETLGGRIAAARTWAYIAHRADWLADPTHWAQRTEAIEERLSDALHARLTERFVDKRTSLLMRQVGADPDLLDVIVGEDGEVRVEDEVIGHIAGFRFTVDPTARGTDRKRLVAAAERYLVRERARRAAALAAAPDDACRLDATRAPPVLQWHGADVAILARGKTVTAPDLRLDRPLDVLDAADRVLVLRRLQDWIGGQLARSLAPLLAMEAARRSVATPAAVRAVLAPLIGGGGMVARADIETAIVALTADQRRGLTRSGLSIGTLDVFDAKLLKPGALFWASALDAAWTGVPMPAGAKPGATVIASDAAVRGYRRFGDVIVRVDLVERIARSHHDLRQARAPFVPDTTLATSFGIDAITLPLILTALGFRSAADGQWSWGLRPRTRSNPKPTAGNAFAVLGSLTDG